MAVRGDRIIPCLAQQLQVRNEEGGPIGRQSPRGRMNEAEELGDVLSLLLSERGVRVEIPGEELRALQELIQQLGGGQLGGALGIAREVFAQRLRGRDRFVRETRVGTCDLLKHLAQRTLPPAARLGGTCELCRGERVERGDREVVDVT